MIKSKSIQDSLSEISAVMQPNQANPAGNVHGGEIMKMMDNAAGVVAQRHARSNVVTLKVNELLFHHPIFVGNLVTCHAYLTFLGNSSMEVAVIVYVDDLFDDHLPKCALTGYFTMVALDKNGKPLRVPLLQLNSDDERRRFEEGRQRYEANKLNAQKSCHELLKIEIK